MRIALYIDDGRKQIVLTPTNKHEESMLGELREMHEAGKLSVFEGEFYGCAGGWSRHGGAFSGNDKSTIIVMDYNHLTYHEGE